MMEPGSSFPSYSFCDFVSSLLSPASNESTAPRNIRPQDFSTISLPCLPPSIAQRQQWLSFLTSQRRPYSEQTRSNNLEGPDIITPVVKTAAVPKIQLPKQQPVTPVITTPLLWYPPPCSLSAPFSTGSSTLTYPSCPSTPSSVQAPAPPASCFWTSTTGSKKRPPAYDELTRGTSCPLVPAGADEEEEESRRSRGQLPAAGVVGAPQWTPAELLVDGLLGGREYGPARENVQQGGHCNRGGGDGVFLSRGTRGQGSSRVLVWAAEGSN
eukprot:GHVS01051622.1.p1 GENE.GHVS01051622.1~~GHVS01051622.1.p1  ORF type:complete len:269 (+),score=53.26 GHVS01051622.1:126-932(+)